MPVGVRRVRRGGGQKMVLAVTGVIALAFPAWLFGGSYLKRRAEALGVAREWAIAGPPCASLTRAEFEGRGLKVRKGTVYERVTFYRQFGHMSCTALRYGAGWSQSTYPACQFTTPKALKVTTPKGEWYFDVGTGQPATVTAPHGQVRCILGADFTMARLNGRQ